MAAALAIGCRGEPRTSCQLGAPIELDIAAWSDRVAAGTRPEPPGEAPDYDALLGQLELEPLPDGSGSRAQLSVRITAVERGGDETADRLVAARFRDASGAESLRARLLRPVAGRSDLYCLLGGELSHDKEAFEEPCLERHPGPARDLALVRLVAPDRDAIVVRDASGWCGPGTSRGDRLSTSFWGVEHGRLVRYLEAITFEAWYESPAPPVETRRGDIALSDGWPRVITVTETVECRRPDEPAPLAAACEPSESTREYQYVDDRYVAPKETAQ